MLAYNNGDFERGYFKALMDLREILSADTVAIDSLKTKKQIIEFLQFYIKKRHFAIECPKITAIKKDKQGKNILDVFFLTEGKYEAYLLKK